jgi:hypothetical protein
MAERRVPALSNEQLATVLKLMEGADSIELKVTVPESGRRSAVAALGMDPLEAQIRQVAFFDTLDLALNAHGVVVRARRIQAKPGDTIVKLRPIVPDEVAPAVRASPSFGIEVDAMPGGFVCSGSMQADRDAAKVKATFSGHRSIRQLLTKEQRAFFADHAPGGLDLDDLSMLGPINVLKLKFTPGDYGRRMVAELWNFPNGSRLLELSTKCGRDEAFAVAAKTKAFLSERGIDLTRAQQTKTKAALEFFAKELRATQTTG